MAVTTEKSTQYTEQTTDGSKVDPADHGKVEIAYFSFTQGASAGDAGSIAELIKLPAGKIRVLTEESQIAFSAFGASRTLDVGYQAYTNSSGTAVAIDADYFASAVDVSSAGELVLNESATPALAQELDSQDGIVIQADVAGGTIPAAATLEGYIKYVRGGN